MRVFVVTYQNCLISIWSTEELAKQAVREYSVTSPNKSYYIESVNVDEP